MENSTKLLKTAAAAVLFCIGTFLMMYQARAYLQILEKFRNSMKDEVIYQQYNPAEKETITYAELIATLLQPLEYDLSIDGTIIYKNEHEKEKLTGYGLKNTQYRKSYQYDEDGNIRMVIYKEKI